MGKPERNSLNIDLNKFVIAEKLETSRQRVGRGVGRGVA
jgi:hypothetical protein